MNFNSSCDDSKRKEGVKFQEIGETVKGGNGETGRRAFVPLELIGVSAYQCIGENHDRHFGNHGLCDYPESIYQAVPSPPLKEPLCPLVHDFLCIT